MSDSKNSLAKLNRQELVWLSGILKDACRERLEKNLVSQAFEERLYAGGPVKGRLDPRPFLKIWEPRYRKFLDVATELCAQLESEDAKLAAETLKARFDTAAVERHGPAVARPGARRRQRNAG